MNRVTSKETSESVMPKKATQKRVSYLQKLMSENVYLLAEDCWGELECKLITDCHSSDPNPNPLKTVSTLDRKGSYLQRLMLENMDLIRDETWLDLNQVSDYSSSDSEYEPLSEPSSGSDFSDSNSLSSEEDVLDLQPPKDIPAPPSYDPPTK
ncbi:hypothetical protein DID75_04655 [Candidatus Marinamargulisbacteria bacterium SCGC AG-410-N11]|nr:hypothetical protein DID75_04655 [Candidatus Marinamargulisbacteria bacterium SCGC AG-410-N11]